MTASLPCDPCARSITKVAAGQAHSLGLMGDGRVVAWGANGSGQLGDATTTDRDLAVSVAPVLMTTVAVAAGGDHSLALLPDGSVWSWGENEHGQLGNGQSGPGADSSLPVRVVDSGNPSLAFTGVVAVAAGGEHSLALRSDGSLWAWGRGDGGQLGTGTGWADSSVPVEVQTSVPYRAPGAGMLQSLGVDGNGVAWAWGGNGSGQLGDGSTTNRNAPVPVVDTTSAVLDRVMQVAGGAGHSLALRSNGVVWGFGGNGQGQLGTGTTGPPATRAVLTLAAGVRQVSAGGDHSLAVGAQAAGAVFEAGSAWGWGSNQLGQVGSNNPASPVPAPERTVGPFGAGWMTGATDLAGGAEHSVGRSAGSEVTSWGSNLQGQLGIGERVTQWSTVPLALADFDPLPQDQGNCLRAAKDLPHVFLDWTWAIGRASVWELYNDNAKEVLGQTVLRPPFRPTTATFTHLNAVVLPPEVYFYRVKGLSPFCFTPGP